MATTSTLTFIKSANFEYFCISSVAAHEQILCLLYQAAGLLSHDAKCLIDVFSPESRLILCLFFSLSECRIKT